MGATSGDAQWYHYNVNGELISDDGVDGDYIEGMYTSGALSREKVKTSGAKELWQHTIKPGLRKAKDKVLGHLSDAWQAVSSFVGNAVKGGATMYKKWRNWQGRNWDSIKNVFLSKTEKRYMDADGTYYVAANYGFTHYNANGDIIEDNVDADEVTAMINNGLLKETDYTEDSKVSQLWNNKIVPGFKSTVKKVGDAFSSGLDAVSKFTSNAIDAVGNRIDLIQNKLGRGVGDIKSFFVGGKKETRWMAPDETYYVEAVNGFTHQIHNKGDISYAKKKESYNGRTRGSGYLWGTNGRNTFRTTCRSRKANL